MARNRIDWQTLLDEHRVPYITHGANVKRGELNVQCPFCGSADPSHHMGIDLGTGWWSCWRNRAHAGKSPLRLIVALLGVNGFEARRIAGFDDNYQDPEDFGTLAGRLADLGSTTAPTVRDCAWPGPYRLIVDRGRSRRHFGYLLSRGFDDAPELIDRYQLSYAPTGQDPQSDRIVMPYVMHGRVMTWTGRAIVPSSVRYLDQPLAEASCGPKRTFYNHDTLLEGGSAIVVVEGPFDALKLDFYGRRFGVRAVAMSTSSMSPEQVELMTAYRGRFDHAYVMPDMTPSGMAVVDGMRLRQSLACVRDVLATLPPTGYKDAGELPPFVVHRFAHQLARGVPWQ